MLWRFIPSSQPPKTITPPLPQTSPTPAPAKTAKPAIPSPSSFRIGLVTATAHQGIDVLNGVKKVIELYGDAADGGLIKHVTYPDNFLAELITSMAVIENLADDPLIKVIYVIEGIPGTAEAFQKIRAVRPDILLLVSESHEETRIISAAADLVVNADFIARGYLIPRAAKELGAKTFVHVSFARHMIDESLNRRRAIMEAASLDLGLRFVYQNAPDPTAETGITVAQDYILENIPKWLEKYGPDTAFFATNNAHTAPMIKQVIQYGGYFIEADVSSPLVGYPEALGLEDNQDLANDWPRLIEKIEEKLIDQGASGRLGTWTSSLSVSHVMAMVEFGRLLALGEVAKNDFKALLEIYEKVSGARWSGSVYVDTNLLEVNNVFLIYQDTYIFGRGYLGNASIKSPDKYKAVSLKDGQIKVAPFYRVGIVTGDMEQGAEDVVAALEMIRRYGDASQGGMIRHVIYPNDYLDNPQAAADLIESLAADPLIKAIVVNQSLHGTAEAFRRIKAKRPDILRLAGEPHEPSDQISKAADLVVAGDYISRGYLIPYAAKTLGAKNFVHITFERHMTFESLNLRSQIMDVACQDLGLKFYRETAVDPVSEAGIEGARKDILNSFPIWLKKYGPDTAFFATNDAHTEPLLAEVAKKGGYFIEADIPSPLLGYPQAFGLDATPYLGQWNKILQLVEEKVLEAGGSGRLGTWAYPLGFTQTAGLVEFARLLLEEKAEIGDLNALLQCLGIFTPGARWNGSFVNDPLTGKPLRNYFLIYQDTYIFGKGYIETTKIKIPSKYYSIKLK
ncbi:MAG: DUF3798 domain-containing protein [Deltaproteobacteria bacterium]|nr:DUF3798 domain-containing protein [Deltaproteobacteria bacterium]